MNIYLIVIVVYSVALMSLGLRLGKYVRGAGDFFVAGRSLGPGLIFSTMLAANIGGGSTVGATGLGYVGGLGAWWWVGSAAIGSVVLAFWIGPALRRVAAAHNLRTVGDYLEFRYSSTVRGIISATLWFGSIAILAGQLIAIGKILNVVAGIAAPVGIAIGGVVIMVYFAAGGLLTSAWVNVVQLTVKLAGFALAVPLTLHFVGGWQELMLVRPDDPQYWNFWRTDPPGLTYLALLAPAFVVSPGLLQKVFGARDDRAVRLGVGLNALGLFLYAGVPVVLGMAAQVITPDLTDRELVLPTILMTALPPLVGSIGLAAVFSAEISAADAVLFMLTTSLSQDLYKRFINPSATDDRVLLVARGTTVVSGVLGILLAISASSIIAALSIFYALLVVSLFVPIVAGLLVPRATTRDALAAIVAGVGGMVVVHVATGGRGWGLLTPALTGLLAATAAFAVTFVWGRKRPAVGRAA